MRNCISIFASLSVKFDSAAHEKALQPSGEGVYVWFFAYKLLYY